MEENRIPQGIKQRERSVFDVIYLVVLATVIGYVIYIYGFKFDNYSEDELVKMSYYFVPPFVFGLIGMITVKSERSIVYALIAGALSFGLLTLFFQVFWPML